jgi:hypothetical protein
MWWVRCKGSRKRERQFEALGRRRRRRRRRRRG